MLKTDLETFLRFIDKIEGEIYKDCSTCKHFLPAWEGNKTSMSQPAWCFKKRIILTKEAIEKACSKHEDKE